MLKLENWEELFRYSGELLEDDYNHGKSLVIKTSAKSQDGSVDARTATKLSTQDAKTGESQVAFEAKFKGAYEGFKDESVIKNDGSFSYDLNTTALEDYTKIKGLKFLFYSLVSAIPTDKEPVFKAGLQYEKSNLRVKLLANLRTAYLQNTLTYLHNEKVSFGYELELDAKKQNLDKYNFGLNFQPANGVFIGLKHESTDAKEIKFGRFLFFFHHYASAAQTVGTEFAFDHVKKTVGAKLGFSHKFSDDTSAKFKVNQNAFVDVVLKHRFGQTVTGALATSFGLDQVVNQGKTKALPLGLSFDLKF